MTPGSSLDDGNGRSPRLTIRQVADLAGVSTATVSRVITGRADVSDRARDAVMSVVREHGYSTNRSARVGRADRTGRRDASGPASLVLLGHPRRGRRSALRARHGVPTVSAAHSSGASEAVEYLLGLGHRRIAAITGPRGWIATEERLRGYRAALATCGVMPDPRLELESNFRPEGGLQAASALLDLEEPPTAIFAFNDMLAIGTMQAAQQRGVVVPEELSVIGFDDTFEASIVTPTRTTVRQPLAEMGRMAVASLVRLLHNQRIEALHVELATKLVARESTAPRA